MRWIVYGAGAVGGVLGGLMHASGHDVALVARGAHLEAIRREGLTLRTPDGSRRFDVPSAGSAREVATDAPATVLLAVKSHQTRAAIDDLTSVFGPDTPVVSVQNGVANEPTLLRRFAQVCGVCVMFPSGHLEPGVVEQHSTPVPGILDVGRYPAGVDDRVGELTAAFTSAGFVSEPRADVMAWKRRKLVTNLGNAVQACCGPDDPDAGRLRDLVSEEGERVLAATGLSLVTAEEDQERRGDLLRTRPVAGRERGGGSSWQSLHRRQGSIESDYLNGEIVLLARGLGLPAPANELLQTTAARLAREGAAAGSVSAAELLAALG